MVAHWWRHRGRGWRVALATNLLGAVLSAVVVVIAAITKFTEGAWVVVIAIPAFILLFSRIHAYYVKAGIELGIDKTPPKPVAKHTIVIVPVNRLSRLTGHALTEAMSMGQEVKAVTVVLQGGDEGDQYINTLREEWRKWDPGVALHVVHNEYASVVDPIVDFIDDVRRDHPNDQIVVLIPVVRPDHVRQRILHNQIDLVLSRALRSRTDIVVARVTVPLEASVKTPGPAASPD
jgi:hypothetical protein